MNIARLNVNVNGKVSNGFGGDSDIFEKIESRIGGRLPVEYVNFIRVADGGHPEIGSFLVPGSHPDNFFDIDWFYSFDDQRIENISVAIDRWGNELGSGTLPIGKDGGGNQIYLNLNDSLPSVWLYLHDENGAKIKIANSFQEFIASLTANPDFI